jgi:hypothetical protein
LNAQVQKLETLLNRIQQNRAKPRSVSVMESSTDSIESVSELPEVSSERPIKMQLEIAKTEPEIQKLVPLLTLEEDEEQIESAASKEEPPLAVRPLHKKVGSPLEAAVENHLESKSVTLEPVSSEIVTAELDSDSARPVRIPIAPIAKPETSVAHVVSKHPRVQENTFGVLLKRTLSLRPR